MHHAPSSTFARRDFLKLTAHGAAAIALAPALTACGAAPAAAQSSQWKFTPAVMAEVDALAEQCLAAFDAPGLAVALIQDGAVIYAKGFGVRNFATNQPFTPDTVQRIASTSKSMSAMLVATHVDEGAFDWDTPVHQVWPAFRLPTDELTGSVTVGQLMGMGTGIGGNPIELYSDLLAPEVFLAEMAKLPVISPPGQFFYQNDVFALAAYVRDLKLGVAPADVVRAYAEQMERRLFRPMGMPTTTVNDDPSSVSDNYAVSYGYHLPDGIAARYPLPFEPIQAAAPAGSVCTTLNEMARYLITQLNRGVTPGGRLGWRGRRVVSAANLARTWQPQTKVNDTTWYAMGWLNATAQGVHLLNHAGSADAFKTDMTLLPEHGLGMLFFTNSESGSYAVVTLRAYLFDALAGRPSDALDQYKTLYAQVNEERQKLRASVTSFTVSRAAIESYLGDYEKAWRVEYGADEMLWLTRASGYRMALLPVAGGYLIGSANELCGFGMTVNFVAGDDGRTRLTITTKDGQVIDSLAQL